MRTHRISAKAPKNRKSECWDCGKMVTPAKAGVEFCDGGSKPEPKKRGKR